MTFILLGTPILVVTAFGSFIPRLANISACVFLGEPTALKSHVNMVGDNDLKIFDNPINSGMLSGGSLEALFEQPIDEIPPIEDSSVNIGPKPYPDSIEEHSGKIAMVTYQKAVGTQFLSLEKGGQVRNTTSVPMSELVNAAESQLDFTLNKNNALPEVLIMHTHTTESYEPYERDFYDASFNSRTTDESKNMVSVGNKIEAELINNGIGVIHDKTIHDYPSYNGSYDRSAVTVKAILAQNPSIKIVLDIHRDAIEKENTGRVAPVANINGKKAAQVMIISGCDNGTLGMPNYMKNFTFAAQLQQQMESDYNGLTRPILFAYRKYNQDLTTGSILIEVGGHANSLEQAQYSAELIGKSLAKLFK